MAYISVTKLKLQVRLDIQPLHSAPFKRNMLNFDYGSGLRVQFSIFPLKNVEHVIVVNMKDKVWKTAGFRLSDLQVKVACPVLN